MVAGLAGARRLAHRFDFRRRRSALFRHQRVLARLSERSGRADLISPALTALNLGQLPASLLLIGFARHVESRAWPFVLASVVGLAERWRHRRDRGHGHDRRSAAVLGFAGGAAFALGLTLPPLLSTPAEVARVSAAMFTISLRVHGRGCDHVRRGLGRYRGGPVRIPADCACGAAGDRAGADDPLQAHAERGRLEVLEPCNASA